MVNMIETDVTYCRAATHGMSGVLGGSHLFHLAQSGNASYQAHSSILRLSKHDWRPRPSRLDFVENNLESIFSTILDRRICSLKQGISGLTAPEDPS